MVKTSLNPHRVSDEQLDEHCKNLLKLVENLKAWKVKRREQYKCPYCCTVMTWNAERKSMYCKTDSYQCYFSEGCKIIPHKNPGNIQDRPPWEIRTHTDDQLMRIEFESSDPDFLKRTPIVVPQETE